MKYLHIITYPLGKKILNQDDVTTLGELKGEIKTLHIIKKIFRYRKVVIHVYNQNYFAKPLALVVIGKILSLNCYLLLSNKETNKITFGYITRRLGAFIKDYFSKSCFLGSIYKDLSELKKIDHHKTHSLENVSNVLYLRTDMVFGYQAGGSIGHIAGVLNSIAKIASVQFYTSDRIPTVNREIQQHIVEPANRFWDFNELPQLHYNITMGNALPSATKPDFVYQRYSIYDFNGLKYAQKLSVPFVLEYNGSEVWISKNWSGKELRYQNLALDIEMLNLFHADLVVVVSRALKEELVDRGVESRKILVNPNGVNLEKYSPDVDGSEIKQLYGLENFNVVGFIGTFSRWHGVIEIANAIVDFYKTGKGKNVRCLMIGDGELLPEFKEIIRKANLTENFIFTGVIPQDDGPRHLAACDILLSPHIPNPDGSKFFGSPTKLFEYMAMGKAIIASRLDQLAEVLQHNENALLVEPGNIHELSSTIGNLISQPDLCLKLGQNARAEAEGNYSWDKHVARILSRLQSLVN